MAKHKNTSGNASPPTPVQNGRQLASYFLSLSLENVRCFGPRQTLDLSDGNGRPARWTVIFGMNGTGKTTVLQSLVGFEVLAAQSKNSEENRSCRFFEESKFDASSSCRGGEFGAISKAEFSLSKSLATDPVQRQSSTCRMRPGLVQCTLPTIDSPRCFAYGAGRRLGAASLSESGLDDATVTLFTDKADLRNPEEWLLRLDYSASKPSKMQDQQKSRLAQVKQLLLNILPDIEDIRLTTPSGSHPNPRVEFKTPYGWVPLRQLGYGYQSLITWVTDFANRLVERYPDSPDPLAEPAVVLVDEIDLHLHPVWQRKLMDFLTKRFPNTQFIVTAHSPLVAQAAAEANLAVLRREGDHVIIDNDVDNIRGWRIDQILTSDLFGLASARPPQIENLIAERRQLLTQPHLTAADQKRLEQIDHEIGDLPTGESALELKEREEIRKTLELLKQGRRSS